MPDAGMSWSGGAGGATLAKHALVPLLRPESHSIRRAVSPGPVPETAAAVLALLAELRLAAGLVGADSCLF